MIIRRKNRVTKKWRNVKPTRTGGLVEIDIVNKTETKDKALCGANYRVNKGGDLPKGALRWIYVKDVEDDTQCKLVIKALRAVATAVKYTYAKSADDFVTECCPALYQALWDRIVKKIADFLLS